MAMAEVIRRKIHELEPNRSLYEVAPLEEHLHDSLAEHRLRAVLLTFFGLTAVSLACMGLYGTLGYIVSLRRREIGLRLAIGAVRKQIIGHVLREGLRASALGCVAGLILAAFSTRLLAGMLYGVGALDAATFAGVAALILLTGTMSALLPALRAARVDPMQALREE
jgi:putative ABC transport system permease protein